MSVETTDYMLLTTLFRGDILYAKPIIQWLTDDQRYGGGFHSTQVHNHNKIKEAQNCMPCKKEKEIWLAKFLHG